MRGDLGRGGYWYRKLLEGVIEGATICDCREILHINRKLLEGVIEGESESSPRALGRDHRNC